jgi:hypothetical protein
MNKILLLLIILFALPTFAETLSEEEKIFMLINSVSEIGEGAKFIRNGSTHDAEKAAQHLMTKYNYTKKKIKTAEDFIDKLASRSSISGKDYLIVLPDNKTISAREFFEKKLKDIESNP